MRSYLLLCDAADLNGDGTLGILRANISTVFLENTDKIRFRGSLVLLLEGEAGDLPRKADCRLNVLKDGAPHMDFPELPFQIDLPAEKHGGNLLMALECPVTVGKYEFVMQVDSIKFTRSLEVKLREKP